MSVKDMARLGYMQPIPKGTLIFRENDSGAEMYIVLQGSVDITMESQGSKIKLAEIKQGGFFGEMSLLEGQRRAASAETTSDSVLMVITKHNFDEVISSNPAIALRIMQGLSFRIRELNRRLKEASDKQEAGKQQDNVKQDTGKQAASEGTESGPAGSIPPDQATGSGETGLEDSQGIADHEQELDIDDLEQESESADLEQESDFTDVVIDSDPKVIEFYFYDKQVSCPVCEHKFETPVLKDSKLRKKEHTHELRNIYHDVDPLMYSVWVCPQCYYAMPKGSFEKIEKIQIKMIANREAQRKEKYKFTLDGSRTVGFVLQAHKAAIECCDSLGKKNVDVGVADLWMHVAWIYDDLKQPKKSRQAREQAIARYKTGYLENPESDELSQKLEYLIGNLAATLGNRKEARYYMFKAVSRRGGHVLIKEIAKDALQLIRESEANETESEG